ncbi:NUDIX domain-containing protein [Paenibacillus sp. GSMTC-2017]|uniref:NUDIX hydrolase n=1 Tax=Paenibacillus sp. GSMTC-2017 TaxID=2794350 RepID=UPI0018D9A58D|nr:NUDIX domain-containing protein [Paenibacillus sp. GSMTC-2017]MBH5317625.1 NUDIX domain-containing protein [Paenibacillus sp. GSMTC-2017]
MSQNGIVLIVSVAIIKDDKVLFIKENKPYAQRKWNFPAGRIELGEAILEAAYREVKEETGYEVALTGTTGIYNFISSLNNHCVLFHFTAEITGGSLLLEEGIIDSNWIKITDLPHLDETELRDGKVLKQIIQNITDDNIHPLTIFNDVMFNTEVNR